MADYNQPYVPPAPGLVTQTIKQQVTVNAGTTGTVTINIPNNATTYLRGYGYTWKSSTTYQLRANYFIYPSRTDQEGSIAQPMMFDTPIQITASNTAVLSITNGSSTNNTYQVVFIIYTDTIINTASSGGEILVPTDNPATSAITPTHTAVTIGATTTSVLAANTGRKGALFVNDSDTTIYLNIAGAAAVLNTGIGLNANGGSFEMTAAFGDLSVLAINGIASAGSKKLLVTEYT